MIPITEKPTVVNNYKEKYDVYIGRGSKWGNPFPITETEDREVVIQKYKKYLWKQIVKGELTKEDFESLSGKKLGCFCSPAPCHGDIIVTAFEWMKNNG